MKWFLLFCAYWLPQLSIAQLYEGFNPDEVKATIALCNSYTFLDLYGSDQTICPKGYTKLYTSPTIGMDNKFQVYTKGSIGIINFRGSTDQISSWVENMYSAMIPAKGTIVVDKQARPYCFAKDSLAAVHSGYALAIVLLSPTILEQIKVLNAKGIYNIIITGHSQGGALAHLCRAYLEQLPTSQLAAKNEFKTYAFANPMCGNKAFSEEYNYLYAETNTSYTIINPSDLVPQMPMHYQEKGKILSKERLKSWIFGQESFDIRKVGLELVIRKFEKGLKHYVQSSNRLLESAINKTYRSIDMPSYLEDINYYHVGNVREVEPFIYPQIELDTSQLDEKERSKLKAAEDGKFYRQEPNFYQHKPYNYYVGILKAYFSREYRALDVPYLPENL